MNEWTDQKVEESCDIEWEQTVPQKTDTLEETYSTAQQLSVDCDDGTTEPNYYENYLKKQGLVVSIRRCW